MVNKIQDSLILSISEFLRAYESGCRNGNEHFCFIIGSGASLESGIPIGSTLESNWMKCIMGEEDDIDKTKKMKPSEVQKTIKKLRKDGKLQHDFHEIEEAWKQIKEDGKGTLSSEYYFDLFKIRFYPNLRNGYDYIEKTMIGVEPGFGYHTFAKLMTDGKGNNLVITTNFDSLIEDALFLYTDKKPLVINHESLAEYLHNQNVSRPIIAKVHRGMFFDPFNDSEKTTGLKGSWREVLREVFRMYTPVVIGYGGGDQSLMQLLSEDDMKVSHGNGMYWCYLEQYGLPNETIQQVVSKNNGWFVGINGFDHIMLEIGNELFPEAVSLHGTETYLKKRNDKRIAQYHEAIEMLKQNSMKDALEALHSEKDLKEEIVKFEMNEEASRKKRKEDHVLTAWDHKREGDALYRQKDYKKALKAYSMAIKLQSDIAAFYNNRGCTYDNLKTYSKAILDYTKAIELNADYVSAFCNRGVAYDKNGDYDHAILDYTRAIELHSGDEDIYYSRANAYFVVGSYDKAIKDYSKVIEINPNHAEAHGNLGTVYEEIGDYDKAILEYERAIELEPDNELYNDKLTAIRKHRGEMKELI